MNRIAKTTVGFLLGVFLAWLVLVFFVDVPPECGEPAACGDDYLLPQLYFCLGFIAIFTSVAFVSSNRLSALPFAVRFISAAAVAALAMLGLNQLT